MAPERAADPARNAGGNAAITARGTPMAASPTLVTPRFRHAAGLGTTSSAVVIWGSAASPDTSRPTNARVAAASVPASA